MGILFVESPDNSAGDLSRAKSVTASLLLGPKDLQKKDVQMAQTPKHRTNVLAKEIQKCHANTTLNTRVYYNNICTVIQFLET